MNGETPEEEIARLKKEARTLANALDDIRAEVHAGATAPNPFMKQMAFNRIATILRPVNDLVITIRERK